MNPQQVQGVFLRATTAEEAQNLGLVGWVMNNSSGSVKGEAQGDKEKLAKLKVRYVRVSYHSAMCTCGISARRAYESAVGGNFATCLNSAGCIADIPAAQGVPRIPHRQVDAFEAIQPQQPEPWRITILQRLRSTPVHKLRTCLELSA